MDTCCRREKNGEPFPLHECLRLRFFGLGQRTFFHKDDSKCTSCPLGKWPGKKKVSLLMLKPWIVLTTRWDSLQAPASWTTTHTSNIQSGSNPWGERVSGSIHRTSRDEEFPGIEALEWWMRGKFKLYIFLKKKTLLFPPRLWFRPGKCLCLLVVKRISVSCAHASTRPLLPSLSLRFFPKVDFSLFLLFSPSGCLIHKPNIKGREGRVVVVGGWFGDVSWQANHRRWP